MARRKTGHTMTCLNCGAKMAVYSVRNSRCMAKCYGCGSIAFFPDFLLERLKYSEHVCPHRNELERVPCKAGESSFCPLCRMRVFFYQ